MNKTTVNRFYSTTTALTTMTFQIDFSRPTPSLCEGSNHRVSLHLEDYIPAECALQRFLCWLQIKGLRRENYQVQGVNWLLQKECAVNPPHGVMGGFLADEMGLGKTIQLLGVMMVNQLPRTLIVLPLALLEQWRAIIQHFTGISPLVYHGTARHKHSLDSLKSHRIILTTYGHVSLAEGAPITPLHCIQFDRLVFDEAHHLRNDNTKKHKGCCQLKGKISWLLTGTPVQNRLSDFHNLSKVLGFSRQFSRENAATIANTYMLRRTKQSVSLQLAPIEETLCLVPWKTSEEKLLAEDFHRAFTFFVKKLNRPAHSKTPELSKNSLTALLRARQSCVLPALMKKVLDSSTDYSEEPCSICLKEDVKERGRIDCCDHFFCHSCIAQWGKVKKSCPMCKSPFTKIHCEHLRQDTDYDLGLGLDSASKITAVCDKINERGDNGRAKLVFTHFRGEIDRIASNLSESGLKVETFDGRTSLANRKAILADKTLDVLVIQIMAGCEGLNLQHFKEIYFVSAGWNPAVEDQAIARCHRMGQDETVSVFRFEMEALSDGGLTLDKYCGICQEKKRAIAEELL